VTFDAKGDTCTLPAPEFVRRFTRHVLPPGFVRIRFSGIWSTRHRGAKLDAVRDWLAARGRRRTPAPVAGSAATTAPAPIVTTPIARPVAPPGDPCPRCGRGTYRRRPGGHRPPRAERQRLLRLMLAGQLPTPGGVTIPA
jgi:hypothetical protein